MTRVHGSSTEHAHSGALNSPNAKRIHNGEEEVLVPLPVDDEKVATEEVSKKEAEIEPVPPEEDEVVPTPVVQEAWGSSNNDDGEEDW
jgi:hypothetical protein